MTRGAGSKDILSKPEQGWPTNPVGGSDYCQELADWLFLAGEDRPLFAKMGMPDIASAHRSIYGVACFLIEELRLREHSRTLRNERELLSNILNLSKDLSKSLHNYRQSYDPLKLVAQKSGFFTLALVEGKMEQRRITKDEILEIPLQILGETVSDILSEIDFVSGKGRPRDKVAERAFGSPETNLVERAACLLAFARGADAVSATEGGLVADFAGKLWRFAVGTEPGTAFDRKAKDAVQAARARGWTMPPPPSRAVNPPVGRQPAKKSALGALTR